MPCAMKAERGNESSTYVEERNEQHIKYKSLSSFCSLFSSLPPSLRTHSAFSLRLVVVFQNTSTCLVDERFLAAAVMSLGR